MLSDNKNKKMIDRLKKQMAVKNINARELAEKADVGRSFVYDILNGKSLNPTSQKLSAISKVLDVSLPYLLNGEFEQDEAHTYPGFQEEAGSVVSISSLIVESTKGGNLLVVDENDEKPYMFRKSWIENKLKLRANDLKVVLVEDDSMEPTLETGDMLLINTKNSEPSSAGIFVLFNGTSLQVKRLETISSEGEIRVISDNAHYSNYKVDPEKVEIVGKVVWFARQI